MSTPRMRGLLVMNEPHPQASMVPLEPTPGLALGVGVAVGLGLALLLFLLGNQCLKLLFAKRYKVPAAGGAIVVTGASTGIGRHAAEHLVREQGFVVYATVRKQADVDALNKLGLPALRPVIMDVAKPAEVEAGAARILAELEASGTPLVGLVNNAGIAQTFPVEFHALKDVRHMFDVHLFGPLDLTQRLLPQLRTHQGRIVNMSSITTALVIPTGSIYAGSKSALEMASIGLRRELAGIGVSVSVVQPAYVSSAIFDKVVESVEAEVETSKEIMDVYGHFFRPAQQKRELQSVARASPPTVTTKAIAHALTSPYPKTRYTVANVDGCPAWVLSWVAHVCPDRFADFIMKFNT